MTITSYTQNDVRQEIIHLLRNSDILTTTIRGVTTHTDTFTATGGQTQFTLDQTTVKNIRSLTVNSVAKYYIRDYTFSTTTGVVTLNTGATASDPVSIQYDYGSTDRIFPDFPREDLGLTSFPRVGVTIISSTSKALGLGGGSFITDFLISITAYVPVNKDSNISGGYGGTSDLNTLIHNIREAMENYATSFYTFMWVEPTSSGPIISGPNNKIMQTNIDFTARFTIEK